MKSIEAAINLLKELIKDFGWQLAVFFTSAIILFFPKSWLDIIHLPELSVTIRLFAALIFFLLAFKLIASFIIWVLQRKKHITDLESKIKSLSQDERKIIYRMIKKQENYFTTGTPYVWPILVAKGLFIQAVTVRGTGFDLFIPSDIWDYLMKHRVNLLTIWSDLEPKEIKKERVIPMPT